MNGKTSTRIEATDTYVVSLPYVYVYDIEVVDYSFKKLHFNY